MKYEKVCLNEKEKEKENYVKASKKTQNWTAEQQTLWIILNCMFTYY